MTVNPKLADAVAIFRELGWADAAVEDADQLPLGSAAQQRIALQGLRTGKWRVFQETDDDRPGHGWEWVNVAGVELRLLGLFAVRCGVSPKRAIAVLPDRTHDAVVERCLQQRGTKYQTQFATELQHHDDRPWQHACTSWGLLRIRLIADLNLPLPTDVGYYKDWLAAVSGHFTGEFLEVGDMEYKTLPSVVQLKTRAAAHFTTMVTVNTPATKYLPQVLEAALAAGWVDRDTALAVACTGLEMAQRPGDRRGFALIATNTCQVTESELHSRATLLAQVIATAETPMVEHFAVRLIPLIGDEQLLDVALPATYVKSKKALKAVLAALAKRATPDEDTLVVFLSRLAECAAGADADVAQAVAAVHQQWGIDQNVVDQAADDLAAETASAPAASLWQPTPPLWQVPAWEQVPATPESLMAAFRALPTDWYSDIDIHSERFWALAVQLAYQDLDQCRQVLKAAKPSFWQGMLRDWAEGKPPKEDIWRNKMYLPQTRAEMLVAHLGTLPTLLCEPSFVDLSISPADLVKRLAEYAVIGVPVLLPDLVVAMVRLPRIDSLPDALTGCTVPVLDIDGQEYAQNVGEVITTYIAECAANAAECVDLPVGAVPCRCEVPLKWLCPGCAEGHEWCWERSTILTPNGCDDTLRGIYWWPNDVSPELGPLVRQVARRAVPLPPVGAMNLIGTGRRGASFSPESLVAISEAWQRGLLQPGVAEFSRLDSSDPTHLAALVVVLVDLAEQGGLSVVWPILDDMLTWALTQQRMPAGTSNTAEAMLAFAPQVRVAVAEQIAPQDALLVPGLRAIAARKGANKATRAARAAVTVLGEG